MNKRLKYGVVWTLCLCLLTSFQIERVQSQTNGNAEKTGVALTVEQSKQIEQGKELLKNEGNPIAEKDDKIKQAKPATKVLIELQQEAAWAKEGYAIHLKPKLDTAFSANLRFPTGVNALGPDIGDTIEGYVDLPVHAIMTYRQATFFYGFNRIPEYMPYHNNVQFAFDYDHSVYRINVIATHFPNSEGAETPWNDGASLGNTARFTLKIERLKQTTATELKLPTKLTWRTTYHQFNDIWSQYYLKSWNYGTNKTYTVPLQPSPKIHANDSQLYQYQVYRPADNYSGGTGLDGKPLPWDETTMKVTGDTVNTSRPGNYKQILTYHYLFNGVAKQVSTTYTVTVIPDQTTAELQDVSLYVGQAYDADAPFKRVLNKDGQAINAKDVQYYYVNNVLTKELDTTKPGTHQVRIVIANALGKWVYSEPAKVTVKADQTTAELQDVSLYVGQAYDADAPFKRVLNKDGQAINAKDVQYYYVNNVLTKELDTTKPGTHQVRIVIANALSKWVYSEPAKVTVKADQTTAELQDVSLYVGQAYDADAPFKRVLNKDGQAINAKDVQYYYVNNVLTKELDTTKPGTHQVRIVIANALGKWVYSEPAEVMVKADLTAIFAKDMSYKVGDTYDPAAGFIKAIDADGVAVPFSPELSWTEDNRPIDMTKPGQHTVYYGLPNSSGALIVQKTTVSVEPIDVTLTVVREQSFGKVILGSADTQRYWQKDKPVVVTDDGQRGWRLVAAINQTTHSDFRAYVFVGDQSFDQGSLLISEGIGSQIVSDTKEKSAFVHINYAKVKTPRSDDAQIKWMLEPSVKEVGE